MRIGSRLEPYVGLGQLCGELERIDEVPVVTQRDPGAVRGVS